MSYRTFRYETYFVTVNLAKEEAPEGWLDWFDVSKEDADKIEAGAMLAVIEGELDIQTQPEGDA